MKKNLVYMLAVTQDYIFAAGNIVLSLIKQRPQKDFDIAIFYDEMLDSDKKIFQDTGICHLYQYRCPKKFESIIRRDCPKFNDENFAKHFSFLKFAKFEIFNLLEKYHHAVWLDADIAIQADPSEIVNYEPFAITSDAPWTLQNNFTQPIPGYNMDVQGVCSAVFVISDKMKDWQKMRKWCYDTAAKVCPYFKNIDQGIFNLLLQEFDIDYQLLPLYEYQCMPYRDTAHMAKIVHFGPQKTWTNTMSVSAFPEWYRIHLEWMARGGSDFTRPEGYMVLNVYKKLMDKDREIRDAKERADNFEKTVRVLTSMPKEPKQKSFRIKLFGVTIFKKRMLENKTKYYLLGIRFLTTKVTEA